MHAHDVPKKQKLESLLENKFPWRQSFDSTAGASRKSASISPPPENHPTLSSLLSAPSKAQSPGRPIGTQVSKTEESLSLYAQCTTCRIYIQDKDAFIQHVLLHYPTQFKLLNEGRAKKSRNVKSSNHSPTSPTQVGRKSANSLKNPRAPKRASPDLPSPNEPSTSVLRSLLSSQNASTPKPSEPTRQESDPKTKEICHDCGEVFESQKNCTVHKRLHHHNSPTNSNPTKEPLKNVIIKMEQEHEVNVANLLPRSLFSTNSLALHSKFTDIFETYQSYNRNPTFFDLKMPKVES